MPVATELPTVGGPLGLAEDAAAYFDDAKPSSQGRLGILGRLLPAGNAASMRPYQKKGSWVMAVNVSRHGSTVVVEIDRPQRRNAFDGRTIGEIGAAFADAEPDERVPRGSSHRSGRRGLLRGDGPQSAR